VTQAETGSRVTIDGDRLARMLAEVNQFGALPSGGVQRLAWTDPEVDARAWLLEQCTQAGLDAEQDEVGNIWAWAGTRPAIVLGSHLDTVPNGGGFDGALGVLAALEVLVSAREAGIPEANRLALVCFTDEEGVRFDTGMTGSRAVAGTLSKEELAKVRTPDGHRFADALRERGLDPSRVHGAGNRRKDIVSYLELHIEQGRRLEQMNKPVAGVSAIAGLSSWHIRVHGQSNHAGTTQLEDRRDALLPIARATLTARQMMTEFPGLVATVGDAHVLGGASNIIPGVTQCTLDVRSCDEKHIETATRDILDSLLESARDNRCRTELEEVKRLPTVALDAAVSSAIQSAYPGQQEPPVLTSMAGHDAMSLAPAGVPCGMIFVRSRNGMSHCPEEHSSAQDCAGGAQWLADAAVGLARELR